MKKKLLVLIPIISTIMFSGCAEKKYSITYNSNPTGASIICNGENWGYSPVTLYYTPSEESKIEGTMNTNKCTAYWASGVKEDYGTSWDLKKFPDGVMQTLQRPAGDGYEKDAQFSLQVQQMQAQQAQARAAQDAANSAAWQNLNQSIQNTNQNIQMQNQNFQLQQMNNYLRYKY